MRPRGGRGGGGQLGGHSEREKAKLKSLGFSRLPAMSVPRLVYSSIMGRAEAIRLALHDMGVVYEEAPPKTWMEDRASLYESGENLTHNIAWLPVFGGAAMHAHSGSSAAQVVFQ